MALVRIDLAQVVTDAQVGLSDALVGSSDAQVGWSEALVGWTGGLVESSGVLVESVLVESGLVGLSDDWEVGELRLCSGVGRSEWS